MLASFSSFFLTMYFFTRARPRPIIYQSLNFIHTALPLCFFSSCSFALSPSSSSSAFWNYVQTSGFCLNDTSSLVHSPLFIDSNIFYWALTGCQALSYILRLWDWVRSLSHPLLTVSPTNGVILLRFTNFLLQTYYSQPLFYPWRITHSRHSLDVA